MLDEIYQLFIDLDAGDHHIDFPIISAVAREGRADARRRHARPTTPTSPPLLDTILEHDPRARRATPTRRCRRMVTNLDASDYLGRLAIGRVVQRHAAHAASTVALLDEEFAEGQPPLQAPAQPADGASTGIGRDEVDELSAGDLFVVAGFPEVEIGDTIADADNPERAAPPRASTSRCCA